MEKWKTLEEKRPPHCKKCKVVTKDNQEVNNVQFYKNKGYFVDENGFCPFDKEAKEPEQTEWYDNIESREIESPF